MEWKILLTTTWTAEVPFVSALFSADSCIISYPQQCKIFHNMPSASLITSLVLLLSSLQHASTQCCVHEVTVKPHPLPCCPLNIICRMEEHTVKSCLKTVRRKALLLVVNNLFELYKKTGSFCESSRKSPSIPALEVVIHKVSGQYQPL